MDTPYIGTLAIHTFEDGPYIVYRMHKVERRMVKTNAINTQGYKIKAILL